MSEQALKSIKTQLKSLLSRPNFISDFSMFYYSMTGEFLKTTEKFLEALLSGNFTAEDMFMESLNHIDMNEAEEIYWEDNMKKFNFDNYMPGNKDVGEGSWIKIRTVTGYEVRFAKKSNRKRDYFKLWLALINKCKNAPLDKINSSEPMLKQYSIYHKIGLRPYEVWYYRTKTVKDFVMPYQYELIDVDDFIRYVVEKVPVVKVKNFYSAINSERIFYARQRGISKELAIMMSNLQSCYFIVDIEKANELYFNKTKTNGFIQIRHKKQTADT